MQDQLTAIVQKLSEDTDRYKRTVMQSSMAAEGAFCTCDFFFWFIAKRSAAITNVFVDMLESRNHFVGPALVRMQLSGLLTLYAANYHQKGTHEFVKDWMNGTAVSQMLDDSANGGKLMREGHLLERIYKELTAAVGNIGKLYGVASGWVHLDPQFFRSLIQSFGDNREFQLLLSSDQFTIPSMKTVDELNWATSMISINNLIVGKLLMWASCKQDMWGGPTDVDYSTSVIEIHRFDTMVETNGMEIILMDRGGKDDEARFLLWVNQKTPKKNLAYLTFNTKEQADAFTDWYVQNLPKPCTQIPYTSAATQTQQDSEW